MPDRPTPMPLTVALRCVIAASVAGSDRIGLLAAVLTPSTVRRRPTRLPAGNDSTDLPRPVPPRPVPPRPTPPRPVPPRPAQTAPAQIAPARPASGHPADQRTAASLTGPALVLTFPSPRPPLDDGPDAA